MSEKEFSDEIINGINRRCKRLKLNQRAEIDILYGLLDSVRRISTGLIKKGL